MYNVLNLTGEEPNRRISIDIRFRLPSIEVSDERLYRFTIFDCPSNGKAQPSTVNSLCGQSSYDTKTITEHPSPQWRADSSNPSVSTAQSQASERRHSWTHRRESARWDLKSIPALPGLIFRRGSVRHPTTDWFGN